DYAEAKPGAVRARAFTDGYEPGSTSKVITASAAVQQAVIPLDRAIDVPWEMRVDQFFTIHDAEPHPDMQMTLGDIIAESSNIGTAKIAALLGSSELATYLARFGLGQRTGVGFPGEASGIMLPLYEWGTASRSTIAYGQGISATPIQMATVYATIANGGRWVQ